MSLSHWRQKIVISCFHQKNVGDKGDETGYRQEHRRSQIVIAEEKSQQPMSIFGSQPGA